MKAIFLVIGFILCLSLKSQGQVMKKNINCRNFDKFGLKITQNSFDSLILSYTNIVQKDTFLLQIKDYIVIARLANTLEAYQIFDDCGRLKQQPYYQIFYQLYVNILYDKIINTFKSKASFRRGGYMYRVFLKKKYWSKMENIASNIINRNLNTLFGIYNDNHSQSIFCVFGGYCWCVENEIYKISSSK